MSEKGIGARMNSITEQLKDLSQLAAHNCNEIEAMVQITAQAITGSLRAGRKVLVCGNGGSAAQAQHFAEELMGRYSSKGINRVALPAIALTADGPLLTCIANDFGFANVFRRQVQGLGNPGDVLIAISTSGHSDNLPLAIEHAQEKSMVTVALLGRDGGFLKGMADHEIIIASDSSARIQEIHLFILHAICSLIDEEFKGAT